MEYFIKFPGDDNDSMIHDYHRLGTDNNFGVFWAGDGWKLLSSIIENKSELLDAVEIISETGQNLSITSFFEKIENLQIRIQK